MQESWDDLRYVLALARAGRLDGAGGLLDVDPSTVFRRLKACETRLDARLFDRRGGVYRATAEGEAVIAQAEAMEEAALAMQRRLAGGDVRLSGTLRITMEGEIDGETLIGAWGAWRDVTDALCRRRSRPTHAQDLQPYGRRFARLARQGYWSSAQTQTTRVDPRPGFDRMGHLDV